MFCLPACRMTPAIPSYPFVSAAVMPGLPAVGPHQRHSPSSQPGHPNIFVPLKSRPILSPLTWLSRNVVSIKYLRCIIVGFPRNCVGTWIRFCWTVHIMIVWSGLCRLCGICIRVSQIINSTLHTSMYICTFNTHTHDHSYYNILQRGNTDPLTCKDVLCCTVHYSHSYNITHSALYTMHNNVLTHLYIHQKNDSLLDSWQSDLFRPIDW